MPTKQRTAAKKIRKIRRVKFSQVGAGRLAVVFFARLDRVVVRGRVFFRVIFFSITDYNSILKPSYA